MAWRLRKAQVSSSETGHRIEANIGPLDLDRFVLPTMEQLGWVQCDRRPDGGWSVGGLRSAECRAVGCDGSTAGRCAPVENLGLTWAFPRPVQADIFPMTSHVECVAILEPAQKSL